MNTELTPSAITPPKLIPSILQGFELIANHIELILFPVALDLFLWLGPHFQLKSLLQPFIKNLIDASEMNTADMAAIIKSATETWQLFADHVNIASVLSTLPVGIGSLESGAFPLTNPLGAPMIVDVKTIGSAFLFWLTFTLIGLFLGSLYFELIGRVTTGEKTPLTVGLMGWSALQVFYLAVSWIILMLVIGLPALLMVSFLTLINVALGQFALLLVTLFIIWVMVPLLFSPHGIFTKKLNAFSSITTSVKLVRFIFPNTGMFFLTCIVINEGLNMLWRVPPENSWLALVGIVGHAFISTALVAASFVFYRDGLIWVQTVMERAVVPGDRIKI
jgi:hypothetical protein